MNIAENIKPLAFFFYKNSALNLITKKCLASTFNEYYLEYRHFCIQKLKSLFIKNYNKQLEKRGHLLRSGSNGKVYVLYSLVFLNKIFRL